MITSKQASWIGLAGLLGLVVATQQGCGSDPSAPNGSTAGATSSAGSVGVSGGGAAAAGAPAAGAPAGGSPAAAGAATGGDGTGGGSAGAGTGGSSAGAGTGGSTAGSGGAGGGSAGAGGSGGAAISFATDIYPIITANCMPCHTKATNQDGGPLNMSSSMVAYTSLVGNATPPTGAPAKTDTSCTMLDSKKLRVSPGDPAHSYLYIKITNTDTTLMAAQCGPAMPETASKLVLTADQKTKIHDWIADGAKP